MSRDAGKFDGNCVSSRINLVFTAYIHFEASRTDHGLEGRVAESSSMLDVLQRSTHYLAVLPYPSLRSQQWHRMSQQEYRR
eukprot:40922-Eustigmatos_ZCMA.PRE.1